MFKFMKFNKLHVGQVHEVQQSACRTNVKRYRHKPNTKRKYRKQQEKNILCLQEKPNKIKNFSLETMEARGQWGDICKVLKKITVNQ